MNLVGKILVVMILVMSAVFMAVAFSVYSSHKNIDALVLDPNSGLQAKLNNQAKVNARLLEAFTAAQTTLSKLKASKEQAVAELAVEKKRLEGDVAKLLQENEQLKSEVLKSVNSIATAQSEIKTTVDTVNKLDAEIADARTKIKEAFDASVSDRDARLLAEGELLKLKTTNERLVRQVAQAQIVLRSNNLDLTTPVDKKAPSVEGVVLAASPRSGLVEISIGSDDGLRDGHTLEVYRLDKYLGRIEVVRTDPDKAVARVIPDYSKGRIEKEDRVATRLH